MTSNAIGKFAIGISAIGGDPFDWTLTVMMKTCGKCGSLKPLLAFSIRKLSKDGRQSYCKNCETDIAKSRPHNPRKIMTPEERKEAQNSSSKRWRDANHDKHREASKRCRQRPKAKKEHLEKQLAYASKNREQEKERSRNWRLKYPEKAAQSHRDYYLRNHPIVRQKAKEYRLENMEQYRQYSANYKALKKAKGERLSNGRIKHMLIEQSWKCNACKADMKTAGYHLDHIVALTRGGEHRDENVQLLCPTCNLRKGKKNFEDFLKVLNHAL